MPRTISSPQISHWLFEPDSDARRNVDKIAAMTGLESYAVIGRWAKWIGYRTLHKLDRLTPENADTSEPKLTDHLVNGLLDCVQFAEALVSVGWLERIESGLLVCSQAAREQYALAHKAKGPANTPPLPPEERARRDAEKARKKAEREANLESVPAGNAPDKTQAKSLSQIRRENAQKA